MEVPLTQPILSSEVSDFLDSMFKDGNKEESNCCNEFYFETDFLPLKGNLDYLQLLKTLAILEVQRIRICQNIDKLEGLKIRARDDPEGVKAEILSGETSLRQFEIEKVPDIDWSKYKNIDINQLKSLNTRRTAKTTLKERSQESNKDIKRDEKGAILVRGRVFTESKPETYNQLWTVEEQLRLEQLLVEFPPEPIESRRWKKIADALGNRTTKQVCSRVQKYFKKLQKAGIAIPGRQKRSKCTKPAAIHKKHKHYLYRPTTFFPGVAMKELGDSDSEEERCLSGGSVEAPDLSHWIDILSQIKEEKDDPIKKEIRHFGSLCISCGEDPIVGTRWACRSCSTVNLCSDCVSTIPEDKEPIHPPSHSFEAVKYFRNPQYDAANLGSNNYLDPNFGTF